MSKKETIAVFDIDDTLVRGQSQKHLLSYLRKRRLVGLPYFARIYLWFLLYKLSLVKKPERVLEYAVAFLRDRAEEEVEEIINAFVHDTLNQHFFEEGIKLVREHQNRGDHVLLLSNAVEPLTHAIARHLQVDNYIATALEKDAGAYTGRVDGEIAYGEHKVHKLKGYIQERPKACHHIWVYTDHDSDSHLLEFATHPHATNPTPQLQSLAEEKGWRIITFRN